MANLSHTYGRSFNARVAEVLGAGMDAPVMCVAGPQTSALVLVCPKGCFVLPDPDRERGLASDEQERVTREIVGPLISALGLDRVVNCVHLFPPVGRHCYTDSFSFGAQTLARVVHLSVDMGTARRALEQAADTAAMFSGIIEGFYRDSGRLRRCDTWSIQSDWAYRLDASESGLAELRRAFAPGFVDAAAAAAGIVDADI